MELFSGAFEKSSKASLFPLPIFFLNFYSLCQFWKIKYFLPTQLQFGRKLRPTIKSMTDKTSETLTEFLNFSQALLGSLWGGAMKISWTSHHFPEHGITSKPEKGYFHY